MTLRLLIGLSLLFLAWQPACAQSADDFFNSGAQFYISNNIANARQAVDAGLKLYPADIKLKKLDELLKRQNQQQQQQPQQQQQKDQQNQQAQNQSSRQDDRQQQEQQQQAQSQSAQQDKKTGQKEREEQTAAASAREMTPEEAQRLLDAQKGDEQFLQLKPQGKPEKRNRPVRDW